MSVLTMCQDAANELGIEEPSALFDNSDPDAQVLLRMAQKEGKLYHQRAFWQVLIAEHAFTTAATDVQTALPSDYDSMVPETFWNRTSRRPVLGPFSATEWAEYKAGIVTIVDPVYRLRGGSLLMGPTPTAGDSCAFEYLSTKWALSSDSVAQTKYQRDTDTSVFDEAIMTLGIVWRWRAHKGLEHESARLEYERLVTDRIMRDGAKTRIDTARTATPMRSRGKPFIKDFDTIAG